jgi:DNA repair photolyase
MLVVCLELGFPVSVLERSPLVLRDLNLLREINQQAPSVVFFSMISAPDSPNYERVRGMENLAPRTVGFAAATRTSLAAVSVSCAGSTASPTACPAQSSPVTSAA